jgi:hypothetical protein
MIEQYLLNTNKNTIVAFCKKKNLGSKQGPRLKQGSWCMLGFCTNSSAKRSHG